MNIINRKQIYTALLLLPYFFAVTGMLVLDSGDKKMIPLFLISIIVSILVFKKETILNNIQNPFVWLMGISCIYTVFSYYYHGASSRELRSLIGVTLFLIASPYQMLTQKVIQWVVLIGSFVVCINSIYFNFYMGVSRDAGYINPIPYATACALLSVVAFSLLIEASKTKEKAMLSIAFLLSLPPIISSETRGVWLALTISLFIICLIKCVQKAPTKKQLISILFITTLSFSFGSYLFKERITERYERTVYEIQQIQSGNYKTSIGQRLQLWQLAPQLIEKRPILGYGSETPQLLKEKREKKEISNTTYRLASHHYHNQFINKMVKSGIIGLILTLGFLIYPLMTLKHLNSTDKYLAIGLVSLFFVAGLTDVPFNHPQPLMLYLLFLVPICSRCKRVTND